MGIFSSRILVQGVVAVLLSSGLLELWKADPICWHLTCAVQADPRGNLETIDVVTAWKYRCKDSGNHIIHIES